MSEEPDTGAVEVPDLVPRPRRRRVLRRVAIVLAGCTIIPSLILYQMQDQMIYAPIHEVPQIGVVLPGGQVVAYTASDGVELIGWFLESSPEAVPRNPVVIFHGTTGNRSSMVGLALALAEEGYPVFLAEYRGYGGMAGRPSETGLRRDAQAAIDVTIDLTGAEPDKLVLLGHSLGTGVAADAAARNDPAAVVLLAPFTSLPAVAWSRLPALPYPLLMRDHYDSKSDVATLRAPVLIIGGTQDRTLPAEHSEELFAAANEPKQLVMIEGADHDLIGPEGPDIADVVITFLRAQL